MELSVIQSETKDLPIPMGGGTLNVVYYPAKYTRKLGKDIEAKSAAVEASQKAAEEKKKAGHTLTPEEEAALTAETAGIAEMVLVLLHSWDVTQNKVPVAISVDTLLDDLGYLNTIKILKTIMSDVTVGASNSADPKK